ncbi:Serine/threonine-protein kinase PrkC [Stieleria neptunia]|uniref:Serine/threonine-protein kinase PrkC n=1 Tax=Stieleria neptunia TaxID=2527979 RepID=A0A518HW71_9BACT|nr:serine/threonine-protein kinase [Stieleria neptunia]QDV45091.1 Serine/threonine-protein kinase PrkC [Stieleria neptunia]
MDQSSVFDLSIEPATTRHLNAAQKERLTLLLDSYLQSLEGGVPPSLDELACEDPDLIEPLRSYIVGLEDLHQIAVGFVPQHDGDVETQFGDDSDRVLGDFRLMDEIGRGGMGVVYRARQISLDRMVAIKLLPFASVLDAQQIARFKNEAHAAAGLHHPNIVPIHTVGSTRGVHYYAMQFIDGQSMDAVIADHREHRIKPDVHEVVRLGIAVADALHAAHQTGVIHRDVKPSNLMLDHEGKVWVTDFGLALCQTDASLTKTGDVVGTMKYMSPEQARGESAIVDGRTDVFSLGVTMYEMLCLQPAFGGDNAPAVLRQIDGHEAPLLRTIRRDIPPDLETVISKSMSKTRDGRYDTAADFAEDLRRVLCGEPTVARPPTLLDRVSWWANKHRSAVVASVLIGLLALLGLVASNAMIAAAKRESDASTIMWKESEAESRAAVDRLGAQTAELLADIPSASEVRRQLLQETLAYYQSFVQRATDDPELVEDIAVTYGKIGSLQSEIGLSREAAQSLRQSKDLFERLSIADPTNETLSSALATCQNNLALVQEKAGDYATAKQLYEQAIAIGERLVSAEPNDPDRQSDLSLSLNNLGLLLHSIGQSERSEAAFRRSIEIIETIDESQWSSELDQQLASTYHNLSGLLSKSEPFQAIEFARAALKKQMVELTKDKSNPKVASAVAQTLSSLGTAQSDAGDLPAAIDSYSQAVDINRQLADRWPHHRLYQRDLAVSINNLGLAFAKTQRFEQAQSAFEEALAFQMTLTEAFEQDADQHSTLGGVFNNVAFVHEELGNLEQAIDAYQSAVKHQEIAYNVSAQTPRYREFLSKHYFNYAKLLLTTKRAPEAAAIALKRRKLWLGNAERLASVAEELREIAAQIPITPSLESEDVISRSNCVDYARETLVMAIEGGYKPTSDLLDRPEYHSLRQSIPVDGT